MKITRFGNDKEPNMTTLESRVNLSNDFIHGPYNCKCHHCEKDLVRVRFHCIECEDYDLCAACEKKGIHSEHTMLKLEETRIETRKLFDAKVNLWNVINMIKELLRAFILCVKSYISENNEMHLFDIQKLIQENLDYNSVPALANIEWINLKSENEILSALDEIKEILLKGNWSNKNGVKNIHLVHLDNTVHLFFENYIRMLNSIFLSIDKLKSRDKKHLKNLNQKDGIIMGLGCYSELTNMVNLLMDFLYYSEQTQRRQFRRIFELKSFDEYSIKWKDQEEMSKTGILKTMSATEIESKRLQKKRFYAKLDNAIYNLDENERKKLLSVILRRKIYEEIKKTLANICLLGAIPSSASLELQKDWKTEYYIEDKDSKRKYRTVESSPRKKYQQYHVEKIPILRIFHKSDGQAPIVIYEEIFDILDVLYMQINHGNTMHGFSPGLIKKLNRNIPGFALSIYLLLCETPEKKNRFDVMRKETRDLIYKANSFKRKSNKWYIEKFELRQLWGKKYSNEIESSVSDLFEELKQYIVNIYNHEEPFDSNHYEILARKLLTINHIKPLLERDKEDDDEFFTDLREKFHKNIAFFLTLFMNEVQSLNNIENDQEFLTKYSKLWWLFIKGTLFLDIVFEDFGFSHTKNNIHGPGSYGAPSLSEEERAEIKFLDTFAGMAMKAWREAFFEKLDSRLIRVVVNLMEKERSGELRSATGIISNGLIQSFKLLDGFKQKQWWTISLETDFEYNSLLVDINKIDIDRRLMQLAPTMLDSFNFMKLFNDLIFPQVHRPFYEYMDSVVALPSPTESEIQKMFNSFKVCKKNGAIKKKKKTEKRYT